jgi:hypothetical protein
LRWNFFQGSLRQSSVRCLLSLPLALLATPAQDPNSSSTSTFPRTGLTSAYPRHCSGPLLLEPSLPSMACGWLPAQVALDKFRASPESHRRVTPFRVSIFRDHRTVLYAVSHTSSEYHVCRYYVAEWRQVPFWACLSAVWQVLTHDASDTPLLALSIVTCSQRRHFRLVAYPLSTLALRRLRTSLPP